MANINKYIKVLLHPAGGHQGSHKAEAGNQRKLLTEIPVRQPGSGLQSEIHV